MMILNPKFVSSFTVDEKIILNRFAINVTLSYFSNILEESLLSLPIDDFYLKDIYSSLSAKISLLSFQDWELLQQKLPFPNTISEEDISYEHLF